MQGFPLPVAEVDAADRAQRAADVLRVEPGSWLADRLRGTTTVLEGAGAEGGVDWQVARSHIAERRDGDGAGMPLGSVAFLRPWGTRSWLVAYSGPYDNERPPHVELRRSVHAVDTIYQRMVPGTRHTLSSLRTTSRAVVWTVDGLTLEDGSAVHFTVHYGERPASDFDVVRQALPIALSWQPAVAETHELADIHGVHAAPSTQEAETMGHVAHEAADPLEDQAPPPPPPLPADVLRFMIVGKDVSRNRFFVIIAGGWGRQTVRYGGFHIPFSLVGGRRQVGDAIPFTQAMLRVLTRRGGAGAVMAPRPAAGALKDHSMSTLHGKGGVPQKAGGGGGEGEQVPPEGSEYVVGATPTPKAKGAPKAPPAAEAYPAGKRLTSWEDKLSVTHAPKSKDGSKPLCWDSTCWIGCRHAAKDCEHQHEPIKGLKDLHWTVVAQLLRRGGLRSGPKVDPGSVEGRIAQLRQQAGAENAKNRAGDAGAGGEVSGWTPPEDYAELQLTALEDPLRDALQGPDGRWLTDAHAGRPFQWAEAPAAHKEAQRRVAALQVLEQLGTFGRVANGSAHLQSYVRARVLNASLNTGECTLEEALQDAVKLGTPTLAEEASELLESWDLKAGGMGDDPAVVIGPVAWDGQGILGRGTVTVYGRPWSYLDFRDRLVPTPEVGRGLGLQEGQEEERQCLSLGVAGALLWFTPTEDPLVEEVQELERSLRSDVWEGACEARAALGDAPPWISQPEADIRMNIHDSLSAHHEKDYRVFRVFPAKELRCW